MCAILSIPSCALGDSSLLLDLTLGIADECFSGVFTKNLSLGYVAFGFL